MDEENDQNRKKLVELVQKYVGKRRNIGEHTLIYHDLSIAGDDAAELFEDIAREFGTRFDDFNYVDYFPEESEALLLHWAKGLGFSNKKKPLQFAHLLDVINRGSWFEPIENPATG